ncbi:hypothetical protein [Metabacillus litoralis]|uniref:hypothetical protein n=1 Tax=Metabacillus litoralis TaxID=152268 RepID=UPI00203E69E3|nr:hypothetical protein [Metabacillus litoralis]MCM3161005.1 hypothetical protein [Metabacillus litoralis]
MGRKNKHISLPQRIVILADLVELNNIETDDPLQIERYNALEESLAIMENRPPMLKAQVNNKKLKDKIKSNLFDLMGVNKRKPVEGN